MKDDRFDSSKARSKSITLTVSCADVAVDSLACYDVSQYVAGWALMHGQVQVFSIITKPMLDSSHHHSPFGPIPRVVRPLREEKDFFFSEHHPLNEDVFSH